MGYTIKVIEKATGEVVKVTRSGKPIGCLTLCYNKPITMILQCYLRREGHEYGKLRKHKPLGHVSNM